MGQPCSAITIAYTFSINSNYTKYILADLTVGAEIEEKKLKFLRYLAVFTFGVAIALALGVESSQLLINFNIKESAMRINKKIPPYSEIPRGLDGLLAMKPKPPQKTQESKIETSTQSPKKKNS